MLGNFSALVTGSWAPGPLSDLDIVIFSEKAEPRASLCCWGTPYKCDIMFVRPADVEKKLERLSLALLEGLWFRKWACRGKCTEAVERAWEKFLETHIVERRGDYFVVKKRVV
ncbi:hypothetical protein [Pyrobaculum calidifontis]|uniref:Polymerase nucleotidyl transferase domain-containing protein n=1 Tax=Pyrobaculum calidifontis (strain DSM 21063 / JCM 11548 / VA1) TaxID=410359 RepID=A3MSS3_PYRCJ|nr:hypothetical protein [Pyrobaculum calidifontis]ABO07690.1 hypothetical protein Pcal_0253 [Pyrobaculum calidifontis JCM 11548]